MKMNDTQEIVAFIKHRGLGRQGMNQGGPRAETRGNGNHGGLSTRGLDFILFACTRGGLGE